MRKYNMKTIEETVKQGKGFKSAKKKPNTEKTQMTALSVAIQHQNVTRFNRFHKDSEPFKQSKTKRNCKPCQNNSVLKAKLLTQKLIY